MQQWQNHKIANRSSSDYCFAVAKYRQKVYLPEALKHTTRSLYSRE